MSSKKQELEKNDETQHSKISSRSLSLPRPVTSRVCRNAASTISKIPKRDVANLSEQKKPLTQLKSIVKPSLKLLSKPIDAKKATRSTISLCSTKTPRPHALVTSRSNMNTPQAKSRETTPRSQGSEPLTEKFQKAADRFTTKKNILAFEKIKEQVQSYQTDLMKKWQAVKSELPPEEGEYKLIGLVKDCDGQLLTKHAQKIKVEHSQKTLEQFKKDMHSYVQNRSKVCENVKAQELLTEIEEVEKKRKNDKIIFRDILKQIESCFESGRKPNKQPNSLNFDLKAKVAKLLKEHNELRQHLEQNQREFSRIIEEDKQLAEKDTNLAKKQSILEGLKNTLESQMKQASRETLTYKELPEKLHSKTREIEDLKKIHIAQQNKAQDQETKIKKLETDLKAAIKDAEKRALIEHSIGDQATKHAGEVAALKVEVSASKRENEILEKDIQHMKIETKKNRELDTEVMMYKERVKQADLEGLALCQSIKDLEKKLEVSESQICGFRNVNKELTRIQKSGSEKSQKIDSLEVELTNAHLYFKSLLEKLEMDRKLPQVGNALMESLQTMESTQDLRPDNDAFNYDIQLLKTDLLTKTAEFQNLFSTLSSKRLDLVRQENTIKMLLEVNEEAQTLRVKQEAKIGHLEEEVSQLKQTISMYQKVILSSTVQRKELLMAEADKDSDTDSDYM